MNDLKEYVKLMKDYVRALNKLWVCSIVIAVTLISGVYNVLTSHEFILAMNIVACALASIGLYDSISRMRFAKEAYADLMKIKE